MTDDNYAPLLEAWDRFARDVLATENPRTMSDEMAIFFAGATAVTALIRSAVEQRGNAEATRAFLVLERETNAFMNVMQARSREHRH